MVLVVAAYAYKFKGYVSYSLYFSFYFLKTATAAAKSLQSCPTLCDPIDGSPPGSLVPGILQARTLEWVAISFSTLKEWAQINQKNSPFYIEVWRSWYRALDATGMQKRLVGLNPEKPNEENSNDMNSITSSLNSDRNTSFTSLWILVILHLMTFLT